MLVTPPITAPASNPNASGLARRATVGFVTTLSADIIAGGVTIPLNSITGLSTDTAVTVMLDPKGPKQEVIIGFVESLNLVNCLRGLEGTAYDHSMGTTVMMKATAIDHNSLVDFLLKDHLPDGSHHVTAMVGEVKMWPVITAPDANWKVCNGASLLRSAYPDLFTLIGTTFGNVDGTHFNLPNYVGRGLIGYDGGQTEFNALNKTGGEKTHVLTAAEMPVHNHGVNDPGHAHGVNDPGHTHQVDAGGGFFGGPTNGGLFRVDANSPATHWTNGIALNHVTGISIAGNGTGISTQNTGTGDAHNNLQPYAVTNYIIRVLP